MKQVHIGLDSALGLWLLGEVYILRKFCSVNRSPNPGPNSPEFFVSDLIGRLSHLHNTP